MKTPHDPDPPLLFTEQLHALGERWRQVVPHPRRAWLAIVRNVRGDRPWVIERYDLDDTQTTVFADDADPVELVGWCGDTMIVKVFSSRPRVDIIAAGGERHLSIALLDDWAAHIVPQWLPTGVVLWQTNGIAQWRGHWLRPSRDGDTLHETMEVRSAVQPMLSPDGSQIAAVVYDDLLAEVRVASRGGDRAPSVIVPPIPSLTPRSERLAWIGPDTLLLLMPETLQGHDLRTALLVVDVRTQRSEVRAVLNEAVLAPSPTGAKVSLETWFRPNLRCRLLAFDAERDALCEGWSPRLRRATGAASFWLDDHRVLLTQTNHDGSAHPRGRLMKQGFVWDVETETVTACSLPQPYARTVFFGVWAGRAMLLEGDGGATVFVSEPLTPRVTT